MKCSYCGNKISENDKFCCSCGASNEYFVEPATKPSGNASQPDSTSQKPAESSTLSTCALIFAILGGWLGFILAIIGLCVCKEASNRKRCLAAFVIVILWFIVGIIIGVTGGLNYLNY